jgi:hypothetical protein
MSNGNEMDLHVRDDESCAEERITWFEEFVQNVSPSFHLKKETAPVSETLCFLVTVKLV